MNKQVKRSPLFCDSDVDLISRLLFAAKVSASARSTVVVTRGADRGAGLGPVNEVYQWGHGSHVPSRVNFNSVRDVGSSSRWQTHDDRVNITDVAAAKNHNLALSCVGQVFTWGFGADNLGAEDPYILCNYVQQQKQQIFYRSTSILLRFAESTERARENLAVAIQRRVRLGHAT